jgi:hypothetical protein
MAVRVGQNADFCLEIDFKKGSPNPSRIFKAMTELIEAFQRLDGDLIKSIHPKLSPVAMIEDVEIGSLKTFLVTVLESLDDDALKNLDWKPLVGQYLVKAKYYVLDFMNNRATITTRAEIESLEKKLLSLARETDVMRLPSYTPVDRKNLLEDLNSVSSSLSYLTKEDKVIYFDALSTDSPITINAEFRVVAETVEDLLTRETISSTTEMILKVKRPDYLGISQWDFRHGKRAITAKIDDTEWLRSFQERQVDVRPGDSLRVEMKTEVKYGFDNEVVGTRHSIARVKTVLPGTKEDQMSLFTDEEGEE